MLTALLGDAKHTPAMQCAPCQQTGHRAHEWTGTDFAPSPMLTPLGVAADFGVCINAPQVRAAVTKLLDRSEMQDPRAVEAIRAEAAALLAEDTWLENTVIDKDDLRTTTCQGFR